MTLRKSEGYNELFDIVLYHDIIPRVVLANSAFLSCKIIFFFFLLPTFIYFLKNNYFFWIESKHKWEGQRKGSETLKPTPC